MAQGGHAGCHESGKPALPELGVPHDDSANEQRAAYVPTEEEEALIRAREDFTRVDTNTKRQLLAMMLRHGRAWNGKSNWTKAHLESAHPSHSAAILSALLASSSPFSPPGMGR